MHHRTLVAIAGLACAIATTPALSSAPVSANDPTLVRGLSGVSVPFVANAGQWDRRAAFGAALFSGSFFVTGEGRMVYSLPDRERGATTLVESLVDGDGRALPLAPRGHGVHPAKVSHLIGDDHRDTAPAATWQRVDLGTAWPGIGVQLRATGRNVEKIFTVDPAVDAAAIRVRVEGSDRLTIGERGELVAQTGKGPVTYTAPVAYQEDAAGRRETVAVRYALAGVDRYGFALGAYDRSRPVVIDPLLQATYLGGLTADRVNAVAVHPQSGEIVVAGFTTSGNLPCASVSPVVLTCAPAQGANAGGNDGFVARLSADLTTLQQLTYFGGSGTDLIYALAIHPVSGDIFVAGSTTSTNLPCTTAGGNCVSAAPRAGTGTQDGFVARLNASLTFALQTTYFGGAGGDQFNAIAVSPVSGEIIAVGAGTSSDLPCTSVATGCAPGAQAADPTTAGTQVGFAARYTTSLALQQATYVGGTGASALYAVAIRPVTGEIVVGGQGGAGLPCVSPATMGCSNGGFTTAYFGAIARLNPSLTGYLQATYAPMQNGVGVAAVAIHPVSGDIYATGETFMDGIPCTTSATPGCGVGAQTALSGATDAIVIRFNPTLTAALQSTYLGGTGQEIPQALAIHPLSGEIYVGGETSSADFPCLTAVTTGCNAGAVTSPLPVGVPFYGGFVARLSPDLTRLLQATLRGGSTSAVTANVRAIAFGAGGSELVVAGAISQGDLPCTTANVPTGCGNGAQAVSGGVADGYAERFTADLTAYRQVPDAYAFTAQNGVAVSTIRTSNPVHITGIEGSADIFVDGQAGSTYCISSANNCGCNVSLGFTSLRGFVSPDQWVCVRHTAAALASTATATTLHVGGSGAQFQVSTSATGVSGCSLDVDGNGSIDALTDGLVLLRAMFGLSGSAATANAIGANPARGTWADIRTFLNSNCGTNYAQ